MKPLIFEVLRTSCFSMRYRLVHILHEWCSFDIRHFLTFVTGFSANLIYHDALLRGLCVPCSLAGEPNVTRCLTGCYVDSPSRSASEGRLTPWRQYTCKGKVQLPAGKVHSAEQCYCTTRSAQTVLAVFGWELEALAPDASQKQQLCTLIYGPRTFWSACLRKWGSAHKNPSTWSRTDCKNRVESWRALSDLAECIEASRISQ